MIRRCQHCETWNNDKRRECRKCYRRLSGLCQPVASAKPPPRWRAHNVRNARGWVGIVDTHHKDAGHIAGWVRPEDAELALAALNHFQASDK